MASEQPWRSLHPASVLVNLLPTAWRLVRNLWPLALAMFWGNRVVLIDAGILFVFIAFPIWRTLLHFLTFRYRVDQGRLELQSGLLNRQVRVLSPDRIQNVEMVRNLFHRISGLVEVKVETASGGNVEGLLSALSEEEALRLMGELDQHRMAPEETQEVEELVVNTPLDLLKYGVSSAQLGLVAVAAGLLYEFSIADPLQAQEGAELLGIAGGGAAILLVVTGAWLFGSGRALIRHWNFRLTQRGDRLVAEEGLFTLRAVELSTRRVQAVAYREPLIRRLLGFGTLSVDTAASREGEGGTQHAEAVVPVLSREEASPLLLRLFPGIQEPLGGELTPPHPKALIRASVAATITGSILAAGASLVFWPTGALTFAMIPLLWLDAWFDHRHQGWRVGRSHLISRVGWFARTTQVMPLDKLQSVELVQSWFAARWGLARVRVRVAGSRLAMPWMDYDTAFELELSLLERLDALLAADRAPPLPDHEHAGREEHPGDGFGHDAHQEQAAEQHPLPREPKFRVADPDPQSDQSDGAEEQRSDEQESGEGRGPAVETSLPGEVDPGLDQAASSVEEDQ